MWTKPWGFKEGTATGCGLFITGILLQATVGPIDWQLLATPANIVVLAGYLLLLVAAHLLRCRIYLFRWLSTCSAAVSAFAWAVAITVAMGLTRQLPANDSAPGLPGFSQMLSQWSFVLIYVWLTTSLGLTILRAGFPFRRSKIPFWLNHTGLFVILTCATSGNADIRRLKMTVHSGQTEWRAVDDSGAVHELPLAVELQKFSIDEYPPKLMLVDNATGDALPVGKPEHILLEEGVRSGKLPGGWKITVEELLPFAAPVATADTTRFTGYRSTGAATAARIRAYKAANGTVRNGWVSCGSFAFPYKAMRLDDAVSLVMPDREPKRFASAVTVYASNGLTLADTIEVNRPLETEGWKIYQLSYDETKGRWSDTSVFELVRDPWLPYVYAGIWMLLIGALCQFFRLRKRKEAKS